MNDVITIGDGMVTFNPMSTGPMRFVQGFERKIGGAELNVALGCARLGLNTGWISRLGKDEFGLHIKNTVRGEGIDVSQVKLVEGYPTSLNFKEIRESGEGRTFYYRDNSPTMTMTADDLEEHYFKQAKILHITGVFPAITPNNVTIIAKAISLAKKHGVLVSLDPNIRLKLWDKESARKTLTSFLSNVDIVLAGEEEAGLLFNTEDLGEMINRFKQYGIGRIIIKQGEKGSTGYHAGETVTATPAKSAKVVDTVGAGDGFDAGFLYGLINNWELGKSLAFANAVGAMVVGVNGDNEGLPYYEEVMAYLGEREIIER